MPLTVPRATIVPASLSSLNDTISKLDEDRRRHVLNSQDKPKTIGPPPSSPRTKKTYVLLIGPPRGSRDIITEKLIKDYGFTRVSAGDILREEVACESELGKEARTFMDGGKLVPDEVVVSMIFSRLQDLAADRILLEGFPKTEAQAMQFDIQVKFDVVFHLDEPYTEIALRIGNRWVHPGSGRIYGSDYPAPSEEGKDDETGEPLIQRPEDKPEETRRRINDWEERMRTVLEYYSHHGVLISKDGSSFTQLCAKGKRAEAIFGEMKETLESKLDSARTRALP
eukprot:TRINITY_DN77647_c0_g1_i1.p1 TRINITY_DN77647_c0_g1~~TRINITY_DN77647_c0_g1_i1.p1  ORF type:complete len:283 (+),score=45.09 TRINITY_DN77647_c0_g1_i1:116-964(+)